MSDERVEIRLWNYIFENCNCQRIEHERAYSAFMTLAGYDYQEYELSEHAAKVKLADKHSCSKQIIEWFQNKQ